MSVYLFTFHAYRSWSPRHRRGFVQIDKGIQPPNEALAIAYDDAATFRPVLFDSAMQRLLIETAIDVCRRRQWRLHGAATEPTHIHLLVSWRVYATWAQVRGKLKNIMSTQLTGRAAASQPWFSQGSSRKQVRDRQHLDYLMSSYLPRHGGVQWYEDARGWRAA